VSLPEFKIRLRKELKEEKSKLLGQIILMAFVKEDIHTLKTAS
jgi:hypothetical protein